MNGASCVVGHVGQPFHVARRPGRKTSGPSRQDNPSSKASDKARVGRCIAGLLLSPSLPPNRDTPPPLLRPLLTLPPLSPRAQLQLPREASVLSHRLSIWGILRMCGRVCRALTCTKKKQLFTATTTNPRHSRHSSDRAGPLWKISQSGAAVGDSSATPGQAPYIRHDGRQITAGVRVPRQRPARERTVRCRASARPRTGQLVVAALDGSLLPAVGTSVFGFGPYSGEGH